MKARIIGTATLVGVTAIFATSTAQAQHFHGRHFHGPHEHYHEWQHQASPSHYHGSRDNFHADHHETSPDADHDFLTSDSHEAVEETLHAQTFGKFSHVDELAAELENAVNQFCLDMHYNYSHNAGFKETYREAFSMLQSIRLIRENEHEDNREAITQGVSELVTLSQHVQGDIQEWSRHQRRQIGLGGIRTKMEMIERSLQELMFDIGFEPQGVSEQLTDPAGNGEAAPVPGDDGQALPGIERNSVPQLNSFDLPNDNSAQSQDLEDGGPAFEDGGSINAQPGEAP